MLKFNAATSEYGSKIAVSMRRMRYCSKVRTPSNGSIVHLRIQMKRCFKSEVQQGGIDGMAERGAGEKVGVKGVSRRRRCERSEHP
jgi:hypothetical protein